MVPKDTSQIKSKYFDFTELSKSKGHIACEYKGWNGLSVTKFDIPKGKRLSNSFFCFCGNFGFKGTATAPLSHKANSAFSKNSGFAEQSATCF